MGEFRKYDTDRKILTERFLTHYAIIFLENIKIVKKYVDYAQKFTKIDSFFVKIHSL